MRENWGVSKNLKKVRENSGRNGGLSKKLKKGEFLKNQGNFQKSWENLGRVISGNLEIIGKN
jgi:hypothetical protein